MKYLTMGNHYTHKCPYCGRWFADALSLEEHLVQVHKVNR